MEGHGYTMLVREGWHLGLCPSLGETTQQLCPVPPPLSRPSSSSPGGSKDKEPGKECHQPGVRDKLGYRTLKSRQGSMVHTDSWSTDSPRERGLCLEVRAGGLNSRLWSSCFFIRSHISPKPQPEDPLESSFYSVV